MKASEIKVGGLYTAKVSGNFVTVRVDSIGELMGFKRMGKVYNITNLKTSRKTTFYSAAKFRSVVEETLPPFAPAPIAEAPSPQPAPVNSSTAEGAIPTTSAKPSLSARLAASRGQQPVKAGHAPTLEQQAILDATKGLGAGDVLVIGAGAGTGKTSTLVMLEGILPGRGQYTAFNASLVAESGKKFSKAQANTTHSLAFRAVGKNYAHRLGQARVRSDRVAEMLGLQDLEISYTKPDATPGTHRLNAGFLAGQVTAALRRYCQSADKEIAESHFRYLDGLDTPGADGQRVYTNNKTVREYLLPFARKAWQDIVSPEGQLPFSHDFYMKIWELNNPVISAEYILIDECFPAGTMVETIHGPVAIEKIANHKNKWQVLACVRGSKTLHYSEVTSAYKTLRHGPIVRINHECGRLECTANHPIWVAGRGWVPAGLLSTWDCLQSLWKSSSPQEMQGENPNSKMSNMWGHKRNAVGNLLSLLRAEISKCSERPKGRSSQEGQNIQANEGSPYRNTEPYEEAGNTCQSLSYTQSAGDNLSSTWGQWEGADKTRTDVVCGTRSLAAQLALEPRLCRPQWKRLQDEGATNLLQNRHCILEESNSRRGGWVFPSEPGKEGTGQEKNSGTKISRVVSVEVLESGDREGCNNDSNENCQYVYTLSVASGSYFADGVLVKNCQDTAPVVLSVLKQQKALVILVGDDAQQIYEWRGAVDAMKAYPNAKRLYLTQSFRFGEAVASVANQVLAQVGTELRLKGLPSIPSKVEACPNPKAILCRTNACAVGKVLRAIEEGKRPFLVGGGSEVVAFVEAAQKLQNSESTSHPELACFGSWSEVEIYSKLDDGEDLRLWVRLINEFGCGPILSALRSMTTEENADLVVCTAHKSKGREWDSVKLASDFPTLSKACEADLKLLYVAVTRAKLILDITECPFFTGEDALEIIPHRPTVEGSVDLPPTPAVPPVTQGFSWSKGKDGSWLVRGPKGYAGKTVEVTKRDGSTSSVRLGAVRAEYEEVVVYQKA